MSSVQDQATDNNILTISTKYPHALLLRIKRLLKNENKKRSWLLEEEFLTAYSSCYPEYRSEADRLQQAINQGIVKGFYELSSADSWKKRVHVKLSISNMVKIMKEYEAVELIESLMLLYNWEFEMQINRTWEVAEEDKAEVHDQQVNVHKMGKNVLGSSKKRLLESVQANGGKEISPKPADKTKRESIQGRSYASPGKEETRRRNNEAGRKEKLNHAGRKQQVMSGNREIERGERAEKEHDAAHTNTDTVSIFGQNITESIRGKNRDEIVEILRDVLSAVLVEDKVSDEEYTKQLREIKFKHEKLMSLFVRKEIKRAKRGDTRAQCTMGEFYAQENTGHTDYFEAVKWYSLAARQGSKKAKLELGKLFDSDRLLVDPEGGYWIADQSGAVSTKQYGIKYFKDLAEQGYPTAQMILGMKYYFGDGLEEDEEKAIHWLRKAAEQGYEEAQQELGKIYADIDAEESKKWLEMAGASEKKRARNGYLK